MLDDDNFRILSDEEKMRYKFSSCEHCKFYECELIDEYNQLIKNDPDIYVPSYIKEELESCVMKDFMQIECGVENVAEGIGDHFKIDTRYNFKIDTYNTDKWNPDRPVFISAQTGQGKNYFIENTLLPYIKELNYKKKTAQKVLIVSNRIALRLQLENRIKKGVNKQNYEQDIIDYSDCADVISYQTILNKVDFLKWKQENMISGYIFVVCDEAHFFTSDAMFNHDTEKILSAIVNIFKDAIRVYMSATPYECLEHINKYEKKLGVFYHYKRDYSYLDIKYYSENKDLIDLIGKSVIIGEKKWIVFIDDKSECAELKRDLENYIEKNEMEKAIENKKANIQKVFCVDASSKDNEQYRKMVLKESFIDNTKVLIATSAIDNGVNFRDIHNIVISDISKVKCLQMVGRVRVGSKNDKITLYIKKFNEKYIENRINNLKKQQDAYHSYDMAYERPSDDSVEPQKYNFKMEFLKKYYNDKSDDFENAKHWFGRDKETPDKLYLNGIARSLLDNLVQKYKSILEEMQKTYTEQAVTGQKYLEYQLSWFGKTYNKENDINLEDKDKAQKELKELLEYYVISGKKMFGDEDDDRNEQKKFSKKFTELLDKALRRQDRNNERNYGINKINKILKDHYMGYIIKSNSESKKTYWTVVRFNWESDKSI